MNDITRNVTRREQAATTVHYLLGWLTVPVEVLFRHRFGSRWLTFTNFFAGLLVLLLFTGLQYVLHWYFPAFLEWLELDKATTPESYTQKNWLLAHSMFGFLAAYILFGCFHFYRMWWQRGIRNSTHSFDDGISLFEPLGKILVWPINWLAAPLVYLGMIFLPRNERRWNAPWWIRNLTSFTNIFVDPLVLLALAWLLKDVTGIWLGLSAIATMAYGIEKHRARRTMRLDLNDNIVQAQWMDGRHSHQAQRQHQAPPKRKRWKLWNRRAGENKAPDYGDLNTIINGFHQGKP